MNSCGISSRSLISVTGVHTAIIHEGYSLDFQPYSRVYQGVIIFETLPEIAVDKQAVTGNS
jgi:hypothetical protein